ncbi:MAG TPA: peptidylprolyl isomerase [Nocardioides sp.]|nr:peptidylprolyl isomerase [Nocardioides sp.]
MRSRLLAAVPALLLLASVAACGDDDSKAADKTADKGADKGAAGQCSYKEDPQGASKKVDAPPADPAETGKVTATMTMSIGTLGLTLDAANAPCTVNSFLSLADQGYFDGTTCHRLTVSDGFKVLQCGDPTGTGSGGPGYSFDDELSGQETYQAGTLAMANAGPNTNGSQFFIVYGDTGLPPSYTVFGTVDQAGLTAIEKAAKAGVTPQMGPGDGSPKTSFEIESVKKG